jgi:hypothetical protein
MATRVIPSVKEPLSINLMQMWEWSAEVPLATWLNENECNIYVFYFISLSGAFISKNHLDAFQ